MQVTMDMHNYDDFDVLESGQFITHVLIKIYLYYYERSEMLVHYFV